MITFPQRLSLCGTTINFLTRAKPWLLVRPGAQPQGNRLNSKTPGVRKTPSVWNIVNNPSEYPYSSARYYEEGSDWHKLKIMNLF